MAPYAQLAVDFAKALVEGDFGRAECMLAPALRQHYNAQSIRESFYGMFPGDSREQPLTALVDEEFQMENWPSKQPGDAGWAYVGIEGDDFVEAVTVIVSEIDGALLIREIEWGRP